MGLEAQVVSPVEGGIVNIEKVINTDAVRKAVIQQGQRLYDERLKAKLEPQHMGRFVAIEPNTGDYYLGDTSTEALVAAHAALPESRFYLKRIGHETTHRIGSYGNRHR